MATEIVIGAKEPSLSDLLDGLGSDNENFVVEQAEKIQGMKPLAEDAKRPDFRGLGGKNSKQTQFVLEQMKLSSKESIAGEPIVDEAKQLSEDEKRKLSMAERRRKSAFSQDQTVTYGRGIPHVRN